MQSTTPLAAADAALIADLAELGHGSQIGESDPARTLAEMLEAVPHRHVKLHGPNLSVWAADTGRVVMMIGSAWGEPTRFLEISPEEAVAIARALRATAADVDHLRGRVAADAVRAAGGDAMAAMKAHIAETFAHSFKGV